MSTTRRCPRCDTHKQVSEFGKNRNRPDGLQTYCKACIREKNDEFRKNNPNYARDYWYNKRKPMLEAGRKAMEKEKDGE